MAVFGLFKKGFDPETFEKELNQLSGSINSTSQQINRLEGRYKQIKRLLVQWLVMLYVAFNLYNYMSIPDIVVGKNQIVRYFKSLSQRNLAIVVAYPVLTYALIKLVKSLFNLFIRSKQNYLKSLKAKHKSKIEDLKNITNYNRTKNLLNKYDEQEKKVQPKVHPKVQQNPQVPINPTEAKIKQELNLDLDLKNLNEPPANLNTQLQTKLKGNRSLQEKVLDLLIGSDNNESIELRYALICHNCYAHNGLAPPGTVNPLYVKFHCYKCGAMNGTVDLQNTNLSSESLEEVAEAQSEAPEMVEVNDAKEEPIEEMVEVGKD